MTTENETIGDGMGLSKKEYRDTVESLERKVRYVSARDLGVTPVSFANEVFNHGTEPEKKLLMVRGAVAVFESIHKKQQSKK